MPQAIIKKPSIALIILTHDTSIKNIASEYSQHLPYIEELVLVHDSSGNEKMIHFDQKDDKKVRRIYRQLNNDFASQRNFALEHVSSDWSIYLDSDEHISKKLWQEIITILSTNEDIDAIRFPRRDTFLNKKLQYGETGSTILLRAAKTKLGRGGWNRAVHEIWQVPSFRTTTTQEILEHTPHTTISDFLQKLHIYSALEPKSRKKITKTRIIFELFTYPVGKFIFNYFWRNGWKDGFPGLVHALLMSYYSLITRIHMYETWYT